MPKSLNALMRHLRESGISITGSTQKRRLKNIGYYHGYKGYRFVGKASNRLSLSDFSEIVALYELDMQLKALFYSRIMLVETALKNYTLEAVVDDAASGSFEIIWRKSLTDYKSRANRSYREAWSKRQRLRKEVDDIIFRYHNSRDVIRHFRDADKDIPIWAIFEVMTLGNFGSFYECLDKRVKRTIVRDIGMPSNLDSEARLKDIIFALKDFRNAIAHNGVVLDVRFQSGQINSGVAQLIKQETQVGNVNFTDVTDYVVLLVYLMRKMRFTKTECRQFVASFESVIERFRSELPFNIYSRFIKTDARTKLTVLRQFISNE